MGVQKAPRERAAARLAGRQHGVLSVGQLNELGVSRGALHRRLEAGRLHEIHRGVYAVGHVALPPRGRWMAAVLACGEGAMLSHRSAAALWGIRGTARTGVDVTALGRTRHHQPGIDVHRPRRFVPADRTEREAIPLTTVARTLLDLAEVVPRSQLARAFEEAERLELIDLRAIEDVVERARGRRGLRPLRALLTEHLPVVPWARSELERRFLELCRSAGLRQPAVNTFVEGFEVDALWRDRKLIVELDGWEHHRGRTSFERDHERDMALKLAGYEVIRLTQRQLDAGEVPVKLRALLARNQFGWQ